MCLRGRGRPLSALLTALKQCTKKRDLEGGKALHREALQAGYHVNKYVATALITMYTRSGSVTSAREVFDAAPERDVVTWNALLLGYAKNRQAEQVLKLFEWMEYEGCLPDAQTYVALLKTGVDVHSRVERAGIEDIFVASALMDMYSSSRRMHSAQAVLDRMVHCDVVSWNILIMGYVENGEYSVAMGLFMSMECEPDSATFVAAFKACIYFNEQTRSALHKQAKARGFDTDAFVASTLVDMYSKCGSVVQAQAVFDKMSHHTVASWTSLILGYVEKGESEKAMEVYSTMDCEPDSGTYIAALRACAGLSATHNKQLCLDKVVSIHGQAKERGLDENVHLPSTLIDVYSKCGSIRFGREVFDRMTSHDVVSWTTLIMGYVENGEGMVAIDLFMSMDCEPNSITYVAALKACASVSELTCGRRVHSQICRSGLEVHQVVANSLVDLYSKCSSISTAGYMFDSMHSPDIVSWNALITGYSSLGDSSYVFTLVRALKETGTYMNDVTFMLALTSFSNTGMVKKGRECFDSMCEYGVNPTIEHYACVVDMLGRANRLQEALSVIKNMPFQTDTAVWTSLLGACRVWNNIEVGKAAFDALLACNGENASAYLMMGDIYKKLSVTEDTEFP